VEIIELRPPSTSKSDTPITKLLQENPAIFQADIPIIHCNPLTTPLSAILKAQLPSNAIIVLTSSIPQEVLDPIIHHHFHSSHPRPLQSPKIIAADPQRAVDAIQTIQSDPGSLSAIQRFQADFVGSRISSITAALQTKLTSKDGFDTIRSKLAQGHIQDVLRWSFASIRHVRDDIDKAYIDTSNLKERIEEAQARVEGEIFARHEFGQKTVLDEVGEAIKLAEQEMRPVMDRLTWWRMIWRVDEISSVVGTAVTRTWCHDLERKVRFISSRYITWKLSKVSTVNPAHRTPLSPATRYIRISNVATVRTPHPTHRNSAEHAPAAPTNTGLLANTGNPDAAHSHTAKSNPRIPNHTASCNRPTGSPRNDWWNRHWCRNKLGRVAGLASRQRRRAPWIRGHGGWDHCWSGHTQCGGEHQVDGGQMGKVEKAMVARLEESGGGDGPRSQGMCSLVPGLRL